MENNATQGKGTRFSFPVKESEQEPGQQTKLCPFCAEVIQAKAIKCRFCNEFLNTEKAIAIQTVQNPSTNEGVDVKNGQGVLFHCRPSGWSMASVITKGSIFLAAAILLMAIPIEKMVSGAAEKDTILLTTVGHWRILIGLCAVLGGAIVLTWKWVCLKTIYYEITPDRIEWGRGVFDKRVDNLDMFRIVDMKLRRTVFDCVVGIGTVVLITNDKTDAEFAFKKIRGARELYDIIKKAKIEADKKRGVVHLE